MNLKNLLAGGLMALTISLNAQIVTPAPSPSSKIEQKLGLTDIKIEYSRPSAKGRMVFGTDKNALVPFGEVWRTGANSISKISFSDDVMIQDMPLKKGDYGILTKPGAKSWDIHFYKYDGANFSAYVPKTPDAIVTVTPKTTNNHVETFTFDVNDINNNKGNILISWEKTIVPIPVTVEVDKVVMASIDKVMAGPTANDYYNAGSYLHDSKKDLTKALEWVRKATAGAEPRFWQVRKESLILADLGKYKEAIEVAKKSLDLATKAANTDYVKMNEASIAEWMKK
jgi:hypothetical protein